MNKELDLKPEIINDWLGRKKLQKIDIAKTGNSYYVEKLSGPEARRVAALLISIASPVISQFMETQKETAESKAIAKQYMEDTGEAPDNIPSFDTRELAFMFSRQLLEDELDTVCSVLLKGLYYAKDDDKNPSIYKGRWIDIEDHFFDQEGQEEYMELLYWSAKEHMSGPLKSLVGEKGLQGITSYLDKLKNTAAESITTL